MLCYLQSSARDLPFHRQLFGIVFFAQQPLPLPVLSPALFTSHHSLLHCAVRTGHNRQDSSASGTSQLPDNQYHCTADTRLEIRALLVESPSDTLEKMQVE